MVGSRVRYRDPVRIVDEIEEILSYGFERINVADDLFLSRKDRAQAVCREILRRGIRVPWSAFARVNTVDPETLGIMRQAGCDAISFGIESGNPEMLKRIRKGITLEQAREAVRMCRDAGILAHASFMVGLPGETRETMQDSEAFAESLEIIYGYHFLAPFPGTTVRENVEAYDLEILTDDWSLYDANRAIVRTSSLSPEEIERFVGTYTARHEANLERMRQGYSEGTLSAEESARMYGIYRMELTFRLLSEDILEERCGFSHAELAAAGRSAEEMLVARVGEVTDARPEVIESTLRDFIGKGFIRQQQEKSGVRWHWTHNNRTVFGPFSLTEHRIRRKG